MSPLAQASLSATLATVLAVTLLVAAQLGALRSSAAEPPPIVLPSGFRVEVVTAGLGVPRMLALDPSGALLVSIPNQGRVVALPEVSRPNRLRSAVTIVAGLRLPHGLAVRDGHIWLAETGRVLRFRYDATTRAASDPLVIVPDLPPGAHHWTRSIAFGPDGRLYVAIGSSCDVCREGDRRRATIVSYNPDGSNERLVATGLRNPVGLAFEPRSHALCGSFWRPDSPGGSRTSGRVGARATGCGVARSTCSSGATALSTSPTITAGGCSASSTRHDPVGGSAARADVASEARAAPPARGPGARRALRRWPGKLRAGGAGCIIRSAARRMAGARRDPRACGLLVAPADPPPQQSSAPHRLALDIPRPGADDASADDPDLAEPGHAAHDRRGPIREHLDQPGGGHRGDQRPNVVGPRPQDLGARHAGQLRVRASRRRVLDRRANRAGPDRHGERLPHCSRCSDGNTHHELR